MPEPVDPHDSNTADAVNRAVNARDLRIDKGISWGLTTLAALAMTWVGTEVRGMSSKLDAMNVRLSVIEAADTKTRLDKLEDRMRVLEMRKP